MSKLRVTIIFVLLVAVFMGFMVQSASLQIVSGEDYRDRASQRTVRLEYLRAARGAVLDRNGYRLASNEITYELVVIPSELRLECVNSKWYLRKLRSLHFELDDKFISSARRYTAERELALTASNVASLIRISPTVLSVAEFFSVTPESLASGITEAFQQVGKGWEYSWSPISVAPDIDGKRAVSFSSSRFPGFEIRSSLRRSYALADRAFHAIGHLRPLRSTEIESLRNNGTLPGFITLSELDYQYLQRSWGRSKLLNEYCGAMGLEAALEPSLRGDSGKLTIFRRKELLGPREERIEPKNGSDVLTSIDWRIQSIVHEELLRSGHTGAAIVMDPQTGEVLAMVSNPTVDPITFSIPDEARKVLNDPDSPLLNRAISGQYPMGSLFKPIISAMALENEILTPQTVIECEGTLPRSGHVFQCYDKTAHGSVDIVSALKHSCNIFYYKLSERCEIADLVSWARMFGLGYASGIEILGEQDGRIRPAGNWQIGDRYQFVIGQTTTLVTPLQALRVMAVFANEGKLMRPTMLKIRNHPSYIKLDLSNEVMATVRKGLWEVVNSPGGTGHAARQESWEAAGKTGSAEVRNSPAHAWFAGFVPFEQPKYAIVVICEKVGPGGRFAAPVAGKMIERIMKLDAATRPAEAE